MRGFKSGFVLRAGLGLCALIVLFLGLRDERPRPAVSLASALPMKAAAQQADPSPPARNKRELSPYEKAIAGARGFVHAKLGRGGTLAAALDGFGLSPNERQVAVRALAGEIDPARLPADTGLCAAVGEGGQVVGVAVRAEKDRFVRWIPSPDGGSAEVVQLPVETKVTSGGGVVTQSVRQALDELPWASELTLAFADIFQWDIDLLVEPRPGDRVRIVYEVQSLGEVPADLPSFGRAPRAAGEPIGPGRVLAATYEGSVASADAYWIDKPDGGGYFDADGGPLRKTFLKSPLNYRRISSGFSRARRHPITRKVVPHHGIDFAAAPGTPVVAAADGRVSAAGYEGALGRAVRIRHGADYATVYGHLQGFARGIRVGAEVRQNEVIGYVGSTGRATGPHLHYTMIHRGSPIDPMGFRNPPVEPLSPQWMPNLERAKLTWAPLLDGEAMLAGTPGRISRPGA